MLPLWLIKYSSVNMWQENTRWVLHNKFKQGHKTRQTSYLSRHVSSCENNNFILPGWFDHLAESFPSKKDQFKLFYSAYKNLLLKMIINPWCFSSSRVKWGHYKLTNGMSKAQSSPPSLQLIWRAIFCVTLRSLFCCEIVLALITWRLRKIILQLNLAGDKNLPDSTMGVALPGGMNSSI